MSSELFAGVQKNTIPLVSKAGSFAIRRFSEFAGAGLVLLGAVLALSLFTYNSADPSLMYATSRTPTNLVGLAGSTVADPLLRLFGICSAILPLVLTAWGVRLILHLQLSRIAYSALFVIPAIAATIPIAAILSPPEFWPLPSGMGGYLGDQILVRLIAWVPPVPGIDPLTQNLVFALLLSAAALTLLFAACGSSWNAMISLLLFIPTRFTLNLIVEIPLTFVEMIKDLRLMRMPRISFMRFRLPGFSFRNIIRNSSEFARSGRKMSRKVLREPILEPPKQYSNHTSNSMSMLSERQASPARTKRRRPKRPPSTDSLPLFESSEYTPPQVKLLETSDRSRTAWVSSESLEQTSEALQGVLGDYGIGGKIRGARPGPAVTLFEFDPPPGLKASKIESLADDIARSMGVVSTRIATVPGSKMIGIEIPNHRRQAVLLSEILDSSDYSRTATVLPLALGKNILGEPVVADLENMPHLLIAGTTGSGKSVAVNAMILSLLYRLSPTDCRMILIDPKMLEFSVYDGIPHLLTPVVTDPKRAVAALKWVVQEMEERYRMMSRVGVRNIANLNARAAKAPKSDKLPARAIHRHGTPPTGGTGGEQPLELAIEHLPRIVVVVDELADLMMVAGKEIEACVQRLAQMARASGIHLIMATQRPSVDVITGTIKANFPTRISFRLSSKIDSRTILNEQGAEKLLGQGDMLYQAAGSRVNRVHGPFVSEDEIERVVTYLKTLGPADYVPDVTEFEDDATITSGGNSLGGEVDSEMFNRAVEVVIRDQRASTSYLQRKMEIGYNRAAGLMEQLEEAGIVGPADNVGRREILTSSS